MPSENRTPHDGRVAIVVVNYRTAELTTGCIDTIMRQAHPTAPVTVVVVDNDSQDGSGQCLDEKCRGGSDACRLVFVQADRNGGFGYGCNVGYARAKSLMPSLRYVYFLNPDAKVGEAGFSALVDVLEADASCAAVGSRIVDAQGVEASSAHNFPTPFGELLRGSNLHVLMRCFPRLVVTPKPRQDVHVCDWVSGASLVVRVRDFDAVGGFDEGFFLYFEEIDLCKRLAERGRSVKFCPDVTVEHLEGASTQVNVRARRLPAYWFDSRRRFFLKHHGRTGLFMADALWTLGHGSRWLRRCLRLERNSDWRLPLGYLRDLWRGDLAAVFGPSSLKG